jgi:hypothetical protein
VPILTEPLVILALLAAPAAPDTASVRLPPRPSSVAGVRAPVVSLNGTWQFSPMPPAEFWRDPRSAASWPSLSVPGEWAMQGFGVPRDREAAYARRLTIPADFAGHRVLLRFHGVYSRARVWIDGRFAREHWGGFTSWDCDITPLVSPGETAWLTVGVTDDSDDPSSGSGYAKHSIGGILRDVELMALPAAHLTSLHLTTDLDPDRNDATLAVTMEMALEAGVDGSVQLALADPDGRPVGLPADTVRFAPGALHQTLVTPVAAPATWDAEHPRLYTLMANVRSGGAIVATVTRRFGFREIERRGNKLLVNGREVKLRGGCRHDVHPLRGRSTTPELDDRDARLFRDANINFIRTSHYPPSEAFLEACDRYGLYVEEEAPVCFLSTTQDDPAYTGRYVSQVAEMLERDRSHPSVILWSLGNESKWGANLAATYAHVKRVDPDRPVIFSYPENVPPGTAGFDILSVHYPAHDADLASKVLPKLNDEFGHVSCYNLETLRRDPGVRDAWGASLRKFWQRMFAADGCLGGAIWGLVDEVFLKGDAPAGYGEWGIVDGWRRPKPEYWHVKKAYSPIRIDESTQALPAAGAPLEIRIGNWFDHTNLEELAVEWRVGAEAGHVTGIDVPPHEEGLLLVPPRTWRAGDSVELAFHRADGVLVDRVRLPVGTTPATAFATPQGPAPRVVEDAQTLAVVGDRFRLVFSRVTGLITGGWYDGVRVLEGGPTLTLGAAPLAAWSLDSVSVTTARDEVVVHIDGSHALVLVGLEVRVDGQGLITTRYAINNPSAGASELGLAYLLPASVAGLSWERRAPWSVYPDDHIGRGAGRAPRAGPGADARYRSEPGWAWALDERNWFLDGPAAAGGRGTYDFRSLKANVFWAAAELAGTAIGLRAESDGSGAVRCAVQADGRVQLHILNQWAYPDLGWGNISTGIEAVGDRSGEVRVRLTGGNAPHPPGR